MLAILKNLSLKYRFKVLQDKGFTLIELLVVIVIIGVLSSIALPSYLNQANKAKQAEAKSLLGSLNRAQQAYYMENLTFATNAEFSELGIGIKVQSENYSYAIDGGDTSSVTNQAQPADDRLKAYLGAIKIGTPSGGDETLAITMLCEGNISPLGGGPDGSEAADFSGTEPACPTGYITVQ